MNLFPVLSIIIIVATIDPPTVTAWVTQSTSVVGMGIRHPSSAHSAVTVSTWFAETVTGGSAAMTDPASLEKIKAQILQLGAALDRGQSYNPTSGSYYEDTMKAAKNKIEALVNMPEEGSNIPTKLEDMEGEWELVLSTVPHGIFRSR